MPHRYVGLLSLGHLVTDINQGALPALLPFLITAHGFSFTAAAGIVFAANIASTLVQPLFGHAADRFSKPWILCAGVFLAGAGISLIGLFSAYVPIILLAVVSGIGIAAYHPQAARLVNLAAGERKATAMSVFGIGGTIGFAVGPLLMTGAILNWGLRGTLVLSVPVGLMALFITTRYKGLAAMEADHGHRALHRAASPGKDEWGPFVRLTLVVVGRSILF